MKVPVSKTGGHMENEEGYVKLDNGLIIQYGTVYHSHGEYLQHFSYVKPFPNKVFSVTGSPNGYWSHNLNWIVQKISNSTFGVYMDDGGAHRFDWIAIGI